MNIMLALKKLASLFAGACYFLFWLFMQETRKARWGILALFALAVILPLAARAEIFIPVPSTPDISIAASTSAEIWFPKVTGGRVNWIYIKNDCATTLYFDLRGDRLSQVETGTDFPLRLEATESFTGTLQVYAVGVSNDGAAACTFTLQGAR